MAIDAEEKFVVVLIGSTGRTIDGVQVWGPFDTNEEARKWVEQNAVLHLDLYGTKQGHRVFQVTRFVSPMYP